MVMFFFFLVFLMVCMFVLFKHLTPFSVFERVVCSGGGGVVGLVIN